MARSLTVAPRRLHSDKIRHPHLESPADRRKFLTVGLGTLLASLAAAAAPTRAERHQARLEHAENGLLRMTDTIANGIKMVIDEYAGEIAGMKIVYEDRDDATAGKGPDRRSRVGQCQVCNTMRTWWRRSVRTTPRNGFMPLLNDAGLLPNLAGGHLRLTKKHDVAGPMN